MKFLDTTFDRGRAGRLIGLVTLLACMAGLSALSRADEDPLEEILRPVLRPTMARALQKHRRSLRYHEGLFPMDAPAFAAFRAEVIGRLTHTLGLESWVVRGAPGKENALRSRFRDRLLRTISHHGITMEVHLMEIVQSGFTIPAVVCLPSGDDRRPGICVFSGHSRHGLRDLVIDLDNRVQRGLATRLARAGFVAIAVEKIDAGYLSKTFPAGDNERQLAPHLIHRGQVTRAHQLMACLAATEILATHPRVDETRMGAAGVSLGGWLSVQPGLLTDRITAVADFGMKELHVDPDIAPEEFRGEFPMGDTTDLCHILPGMLSTCDRNVLALTWCPRTLLAGHGRRDALSDSQAVHHRQLFERQYAALGMSENFGYHTHNAGDAMPEKTVIAWFREKFSGEKQQLVPASDDGSVHHAQGEMVGEVTSTSAILQSRITATAAPVVGDMPGAAGVGRFELSVQVGPGAPIMTAWLEATPARDFIIKTRVTGLTPGTRYTFRLRYGRDRGNTRPVPLPSSSSPG